MSLRTRFLIVVGTVLVILAVATAFLPQRAKSTEDDQADGVLAAAVPAVERLLAEDSHPSVALSDVYAARLTSTGSTEVIARPVTAPSRVPDRPSHDSVEPKTVGSSAGAGSWRAVVVSSGGDRILVAVPVADATVGVLGIVLVGGRILLLVMVMLVGWWLLRLGLLPIRDVTRVADAIASGDRSKRLALPAPGTEAARLAQSFNDMLDQQHAAEDRLRRFVADASHELRTPVASISGFADLYRHDAIAADDLDEIMRRIGQESARMRDLVEDMLLLARLDQGRPAMVGPVDLVSLAADAVLDASAVYPSREIVVRGDVRAVVDGDEMQLREVIGNLLMNALNYTNGHVEIDVHTAVDRATLSVRDHGPGLDPQDAARVFDRFWRGPETRGRSGSGLGLPIVQGIIDSHGGSLVFESARSSGTEVALTLPTPLWPERGGQETGR